MDRATACRVMQDVEQMITALRAGDASAEPVARELLLGLIEVSSGPQLALFLAVVDVCAARAAKDD